MKLRQFLVFCSIILLTVIFVGCAGKKIKAPEDPVKKYKQEFLLKYGFFVTNEKPVTYYKDALGIEGKEKNIFNSLKTIEDIDKFIEIFLKTRDYDPNTPENEFKELVDGRIKDVENEIFAADLDIPLTRFDKNGGLNGELAHIYLLHGMPHFKARISEGMSHVELMVWYYFYQDRPLMRFLFYNDGTRMRLFRDQFPVNSWEELVYSTLSPLKKISRDKFSNWENTWVELKQNEIYITLNGYTEPVFTTALFEFSYFSEDVVMEGGGGKKFGALDPPEPAALTATRLKPTVLGQPGDLTGREFIKNSYASFIPAELQVTNDNGRPSFTLIIGYADTDWEAKGTSMETLLNLRMSFQNKKTRAISEFWVNLPISKTRSEVEKKRGSVKMSILLDDIGNFAENQTSQSTLGQLVDGLEPGNYILNVDLRHPVTKKFAGGWREEIVIR